MQPASLAADRNRGDATCKTLSSRSGASMLPGNFRDQVAPIGRAARQSRLATRRQPRIRPKRIPVADAPRGQASSPDCPATLQRTATRCPRWRAPKIDGVTRSHSPRADSGKRLRGDEDHEHRSGT